MIKSVNYKTTSYRLGAGFTLLEILLVVGIISILAGIIILAINPNKQLGDTRNAQRRSDVLTVLNALYQYSIDNNGDFNTITNAGGTIFQSNNPCSANGTDALRVSSKLVGATSTYLVAIPHDPLAANADIGSEYYIVQNTTTNRLTVCAPLAEGGAVISATR